MLEFDITILLFILIVLANDIANLFNKQLLTETQEKLLYLFIIITASISLIIHTNLLACLTNAVLVIIWGINLYKLEK